MLQSNMYFATLQGSWPKTNLASLTHSCTMDLHQMEDDQSFQDIDCLPRRIQEATARDIIHRSPQEWPEAAKKEFDLICNYLRQQRRRPDSDAWTLDTPPGGLFEPTWIGSKPDALPPMWPRVSDAVLARTGQEMKCPAAEREGHDISPPNHVPGWQVEHNGKKNALVQGLKAKGILTEDLKWQYLSWNPEAKALQPHQKTPLTSEDVCQTLRRIHQLGENPNLVLKFAALRPLNQDNLPQDAAIAIPWRLDVSLRGPEAPATALLSSSLCG